MPILLALIAATLFALGTVLQQRIAMTSSDEDAASVLFMLRLAKHPTWLAGIGCTLVGFVFHASALAAGELVVVQPILSMTMVIALPLGAALSNQRITRRDVGASIGLTVALAVFVIAINPAAGVKEPTIEAWLIGGGIVLVVAAVLTAMGLNHGPAAKATFVGLAAGALFGLHGAITKGTVEEFGNGLLGPFETWGLYVLIAIGLVSMTVSQISLQAGDLPPAIATQSIAAPLVGVALGITVFEERLHENELTAALSIIALVAMVVGIGVLSFRASPASPDPRR